MRMKHRIIEKEYLVMRMKENFFIKGLGKAIHTKCLIQDIARAGYEWKEIERIARRK